MTMEEANSPANSPDEWRTANEAGCSAYDINPNEGQLPVERALLIIEDRNVVAQCCSGRCAGCRVMWSTSWRSVDHPLLVAADGDLNARASSC
jgi:hypothetical protein